MNPEIFRKASQIFTEVCDLDANEQVKIIQKGCAGDLELEEIVYDLIRSDKKAQKYESQHGEKTETKTKSIPEIPGFSIKNRLGEGGMGVVWRAEQEATRREVALKVFSRHIIGSERSRLRFEREVELAAMLEHPGIARVYDSGINDDIPYYAMELVEGLDLDSYLKDKDPSDREIIRLFVSLCRAVEQAHIQGVIHRDLKPSNVIIRHDGSPVIVDFGLAKTFEDGSDNLTVSVEGQIVGTPAYMSPEQAQGEVKQLDTRTDVYSIGVMLFRALSGRFPHDARGNTLEILRSISETQALSLLKARPSVDSDLDVLVSKSLAHERSERYSNAGDFGDDLERWLDDQPIEARPQSTIYILKKKVKRHRIPLTISMLLIIGAIIAAISWVASIRASKDETEHWAYGYRIQLADQAIKNFKTLEAKTLLKQCPPNLRDWEWYFLNRQLQQGVQFFEGQNLIELSFNSSGTLAALGTRKLSANVEDAEIIIMDGELKKIVHRIPFANSVHELTFSPDGQELWVGGRGLPLTIYSVKTWEPIRKEPQYNFVRGIQFSPDGKHVAIACFNQGLYVRNIETGKQSHFPAQRCGKISLSFSEDSKLLLFTYDQWVKNLGIAKLIKLENMTVWRRWKRSPRFSSSFIHPNGKIAVLGSNSSIILWNVVNNVKYKIPFQEDGIKVALGKRSDRFYTLSGTSIDVWELKPIEHQGKTLQFEARRLWSVPRMGTTQGPFQTDFQGKRMFTLGKENKIFDISKDPRVDLITQHSSNEAGSNQSHIKLNFNGSKVAVSSSNKIEIFSFPNYQSQWSKKNHPHRARGIAWSSDGNRFACAWSTVFNDPSKPRSEIVLYDPQNGEELASQELEQRATALTFINNSDHLAVFMGPIAGLSPNSKELSKVKIFNLPDLKLIWESREIAEPGRAPTLRSNRDGSLLGLETRQSLYVWETRTWKLKHKRVYQGSYSLTVFDFHPTEDKIALIDQGNLIEISSQTFKTLRNLGSIDGIPQGFCYSPNGKRIVVGNKRGFTLINSFTGAPLVKVESDYSIFSTSFTPDGKFLLTSSNENQLFQAWKR